MVVPTVGGPWLGDQLAALAAQTRPPAQLVVVNNGPPGAVDAVVERWRARLPQLELVEDRTQALPGFARNVGADRARYPGILFLDDDDVVNAEYVAAMGDALDDSELVAAGVDLEELNPPELTRRWGSMQAEGPMTYHDFLPWSISAALGVRRETFEELGGFDGDYPICEDTDFSWRAQLDADARLTFVPGARVSYRLRSGVRPAFRQARIWASWEAALHRRYRSRGLPPRGDQLRALLRWGRPLLLLAGARRREDLVIVARQLGGCVGRLQGSVRHRHLHL
ncbi:Glycosyltransferase, GT2 family [Geodermatophilus dictyosporus]|uniref:Glycosyltransferase, GT2 family n=1 Tax=Geodermatophilus dictyosporus TaxID=1523247 RepID=A0A1I5MXW9_9ACTN|nr:Glycosyltransferase, GT2 family [Geodermatophilus dictyosporus]